MNGPGSELTPDTAMELIAWARKEGHRATLEVRITSMYRFDWKPKAEEVTGHWCTEEAAQAYVEAAKERASRTVTGTVPLTCVGMAL